MTEVKDNNGETVGNIVTVEIPLATYQQMVGDQLIVDQIESVLDNKGIYSDDHRVMCIKSILQKEDKPYETAKKTD